MRRSGFKRPTYAEALEKAHQKANIARSKPKVKKPKKSPRAKKMELKKEIIEQYGLPKIPCSRWGINKTFTRQDILKGMLWYVFSRWVRRRDNGMCIACGLPKTYEELQAGHFAPVGGNDLELCFDELNVNGECETCNADFEGGGWHLVLMKPNLVKKWGQVEVDRIEQLKSMKRATKWDESVYVEKIKYYYQSLLEIENNL
jgi:hypothetical protein